MFQYLSTVSNVADEGGEDKSDDEGQEQVFDTLDTQIVEGDGRLPVNCICIQQHSYNSTTLNPL